MMPVAWTLKTAPTTEPITKAQAKMHFRHGLAFGDTEEDSLIDGYISAARGIIEERTGRSLFTQTWQVSMPTWAQALWLPRAVPLQSVTHIKYYDTSNVLQTLASTVYTLPSFEEPALVLLADGQTWPSLYNRVDAVQAEYVTGATAVSAIPKPLIQAIQLLVAHWYDYRGAVAVGTITKEVEFAVESLCAPFVRAWREPVEA